MAWRIALMCLVALALSAKGFAASALMACEPAQHQPALQQTQAPCAEFGHALPDEPLSQTDVGPCSTDADCCSGAAIMIDFGAVSGSASIQAPPVATIPRGTARLLIGGLERPPKRPCLSV